MKIVFNDTPSKLASYDFSKIKKKRGENILVETILDIFVPLQTKTARIVTKLKKEIQCWEREFTTSHNLCAPTVTDRKNDKTIAQKLRLRLGHTSSINIESIRDD